jgi:hypothetical protein
MKPPSLSVGDDSVGKSLSAPIDLKEIEDKLASKDTDLI